MNLTVGNIVLTSTVSGQLATERLKQMTSPDDWLRRGGEVSLGELVRRFDELTAQLSALIERLDSNYVRKDVYIVQLEKLTHSQHELRTDLDSIVDQQRRNFRLALSGIILPILSAIMAGLLLSALKR